jgi:hypothetical protein
MRRLASACPGRRGKREVLYGCPRRPRAGDLDNADAARGNRKGQRDRGAAMHLQSPAFPRASSTCQPKTSITRLVIYGTIRRSWIRRSELAQSAGRISDL